jgi:hypothetical protein
VGGVSHGDCSARATHIGPTARAAGVSAAPDGVSSVFRCGGLSEAKGSGPFSVGVGQARRLKNEKRT